MTFSTDVIGDSVLVRSDGRPAYNFAVVVDDALMEITHVIRGEDHISNTPRQVLLYQALGFTPPAFAHLSLVMGPDHTPLSKRHGATSVAEFRARGYLPEALMNYLALIGWSPGGRRGAAADRRAGAAVRDRGRRAQRRRLRPGEARVDEPALHEGGGARAARGGVAARSSSRAAIVREADRRGDGLPRVAAADGGRLGRSARGDSRSPQVPLRVRRGRRARATTMSPRCCTSAGAREVIAALAEELDGRRCVDREAFRAVANRVKAAHRAEGQERCSIRSASR